MCSVAHIINYVRWLELVVCGKSAGTMGTPMLSFQQAIARQAKGAGKR